jgi:hypothetical protein
MTEPQGECCLLLLSMVVPMPKTHAVLTMLCSHLRQAVVSQHVSCGTRCTVWMAGAHGECCLLLLLIALAMAS